MIVIPKEERDLIGAGRRLPKDVVELYDKLSKSEYGVGIASALLRKRRLKIDSTYETSSSQQQGPYWLLFRRAPVAYNCQAPGDDHPYSGIHKESKQRRYYSEPYHLSIFNIEEMLKFANRLGLRFSIDGCSRWFPGRTFRVTWARKEKKC